MKQFIILLAIMFFGFSLNISLAASDSDDLIEDEKPENLTTVRQRASESRRQCSHATADLSRQARKDLKKAKKDHNKSCRLQVFEENVAASSKARMNACQRVVNHKVKNVDRYRKCLGELLEFNKCLTRKMDAEFTKAFAGIESAYPEEGDRRTNASLNSNACSQAMDAKNQMFLYQTNYIITAYEDDLDPKNEEDRAQLRDLVSPYDVYQITYSDNSRSYDLVSINEEDGNEGESRREDFSEGAVLKMASMAKSSSANQSAQDAAEARANDRAPASNNSGGSGSSGGSSAGEAGEAGRGFGDPTRATGSNISSAGVH